MNISEIKRILSGNHIASDRINLIIGALKEEDLGKLTQPEKEVLKQMLENMLLLIQDPTSGAHLDDAQKAESLLSALSE
jgi:hypothetical protein